MSDPGLTRFVRAKLVYVAQPEEGFLVDLKLDASDRIVGKWPLYGRWEEYGKHDQLDSYPVSINGDGSIDFGEGHQHYATNIRERSMKLGELCTVWDSSDRDPDGEEWTYRVQTVSVLGEPS